MSAKKTTQKEGRTSTSSRDFIETVVDIAKGNKTDTWENAGRGASRRFTRWGSFSSHNLVPETKA
jgi:hypothetical protein